MLDARMLERMLAIILLSRLPVKVKNQENLSTCKFIYHSFLQFVCVFDLKSGR